MPQLNPPYEDWKPGEDRIRHHERYTGNNTRIERWQWNQEAGCWELTAVFSGEMSLTHGERRRRED